MLYIILHQTARPQPPVIILNTFKLDVLNVTTELIHCKFNLTNSLSPTSGGGVSLSLRGPLVLVLHLVGGALRHEDGLPGRQHRLEGLMIVVNQIRDVRIYFQYGKTYNTYFTIALAWKRFAASPGASTASRGLAASRSAITRQALSNFPILQSPTFLL